MKMWFCWTTKTKADNKERLCHPNTFPGPFHTPSDMFRVNNFALIILLKPLVSVSLSHRWQFCDRWFMNVKLPRNRKVYTMCTNMNDISWHRKFNLKSMHWYLNYELCVSAMFLLMDNYHLAVFDGFLNLFWLVDAFTVFTLFWNPVFCGLLTFYQVFTSPRSFCGNIETKANYTVAKV